MTAAQLANIWSLEPGYDKKDLLCGVEPASLFRSNDGGDSWEVVKGISNHEHARKWQPGNGGLCMHTILRHGNRLHLGISTGGHYLSEDGGQTFKAANQGVGPGSRPIPILNSVSAFTRSPATQPPPDGSTCRTTAAGPNGAGPAGRGPASASSAATTTAKRGDPSPGGCHPILASRSWCTRTAPTRSTSCRSSR